jgi:hypothetical protein
MTSGGDLQLVKIKKHLILAHGGRGIMKSGESHIADKADVGVDGRLGESLSQGDKD